MNRTFLKIRSGGFVSVTGFSGSGKSTLLHLLSGLDHPTSGQVTPENAREILANLGKNIDVVGGIFDEAMLSLRNCAGLQLSQEPLCCAVSMHEHF